MFYKTYIFKCDDPRCSAPLSTEILSIEAARVLGWAISKDRKKCYCPRCAPVHRNVGLYGAENVGWRRR